MHFPETKVELRKKMRSALGQISMAMRITESMELCSRLEPQLQSAHAILFFSPLPDELDVWPLLEKLLKTTKICALPAFDEETKVYSARRIKNLETDIFSGKFGVSEPLVECDEIPLNKFDLVLVPGIAFDETGHRLGRGKGYYDRLLSLASGIKCGVAYDFQMIEQIPAEAHDVKVDFIFTPSGSVRRKK